MRVNSRNRKLKVNGPSRSYLESARQIRAILDAAGELDASARSDHRHMARRAMVQTSVFSGIGSGSSADCGGLRRDDGPYWARTSDLRLVEPALSQQS
jgi:hypothetical protein